MKINGNQITDLLDSVAKQYRDTDQKLDLDGFGYSLAGLIALRLSWYTSDPADLSKLEKDFLVAVIQGASAALADKYGDGRTVGDLREIPMLQVH